jgi:hypothetical protein
MVSVPPTSPRKPTRGDCIWRSLNGRGWWSTLSTVHTRPTTPDIVAIESIVVCLTGDNNWRGFYQFSCLASRSQIPIHCRMAWKCKHHIHVQGFLVVRYTMRLREPPAIVVLDGLTET